MNPIAVGARVALFPRLESGASPVRNGEVIAIDHLAISIRYEHRGALCTSLFPWSAIGRVELLAAAE